MDKNKKIMIIASGVFVVVLLLVVAGLYYQANYSVESNQKEETKEIEYVEYDDMAEDKEEAKIEKIPTQKDAPPVEVEGGVPEGALPPPPPPVDE